MLTIDQFEPWHADRVAEDLREEDIVEMLAVYGEHADPAEILVTWSEGSDFTWTLFSDGDPVALLGVAAEDDGSGRPWIVGHKRLDTHSKALHIIVKASIEGILGMYPVLRNIKWIGNTRQIEWLRRLGAKFTDDTVTYGGLRFRTFEFRS